MRETVETLPTRAPMRPRTGRRVEIRNARRGEAGGFASSRNDRSAYSRQVN